MMEFGKLKRDLKVTYPTLTASVTGAGFPVLVFEEENFHRGTPLLARSGAEETSAGGEGGFY